MSKHTQPPLLLKLALLLCGMCVSSLSKAGDAAHVDVQQAEATAKLQLRAYGDFTLNELGQLREAVAKELGSDVELLLSDEAPAPSQAQVVVRYSANTAELTVSLTDERGATISRVIEAPADRTQLADVAALMSVNLRAHQIEDLSSSDEQAPQAQVETTSAASSETHSNDTPAPNTHPEFTLSASVSPQQYQSGPHRLANASVFYPLATNAHLPDLRTHFDINLLYSHVGEVEGLQLGVVNAISGQLKGIQVAGLVNTAGETSSGLQVAGLFNESRRLSPALQVAFGVNRAARGGQGAQVALGPNLSTQRFQGAQLSFTFNHNNGLSEGVQASTLFNHSRGLKGLQANLGVNVAAKVSGVQLGLVNIAGDVEGGQVGLVNIADDVKGVPLGLFNVTKTGGLHVPVWWSNTANVNVGLKFATRYTYTMLAFSGDVFTQTKRYGPMLALGVRVPTLPKTAIDIDLSGSYLLGTRLCCYETREAERTAHGEDRSYYRLRVIPHYSFQKHLSVFVGGGISVSVPFALYSNFDKGDRNVTTGLELLGGMEF